MNDFAEHITAVRKAMQQDSELAYGYHANIAMCLWDGTTLSRNKANQAATLVMRLLFDTTTPKNDQPQTKD